MHWLIILAAILFASLGHAAGTPALTPEMFRREWGAMVEDMAKLRKLADPAHPRETAALALWESVYATLEREARALDAAGSTQVQRAKFVLRIRDFDRRLKAVLDGSVNAMGLARVGAPRAAAAT